MKLRATNLCHRRPALGLLMILSTLLAAQLAQAARPADAGKAGRPDEIRLLWTNDTHGFFLPVYHAEPENVDQYAGIAATEGKLGGYAQIATLAKRLRHGRVNAMLTDSGDTFDGSPVAQITRGERVIPVLNAIGYDAWVPGNRDFAYGRDDFLRVVDMIDFPTVATTLRYSESEQNTPEQRGELVYPPFLVKDLPTKRVILLGLVHPLVDLGGAFCTGIQCAPNGSPQGFEVAAEVSALVAQLRATYKPDLVVAMSHFGKLQDEKFATLQAGIDVILGGHSHDIFLDPKVLQGADGRQVIVTQAGSHGVYLGQLDVRVEPNGEITLADSEIHRIVSKDVKPDRKVLRLAQKAYAPFKRMLEEEIGTTSTLIWRRGETQSNMANFLCDTYTQIFGAQLCHFRGIRYGETIIPGVITVGDVWNMVSPNWGDNKVYVGMVPGKFVRNVLNTLLNQQFGPDPYQWPGGDVMRWNEKVRYTYRPDAPQDQKLVDLTVDGDPMVVDTVVNPVYMEKLYSFASTTPPPPFPETAEVVPDTTAVDEIVNYIKQVQMISPVLDDRTVELD